MDTLTFNSHSTDTALIILVKGQIDLPTQDRFEEVVTTALASSSVVVDLSQVSFLSVSGLRSLIACHRASVQGRRSLIFAAAPRSALRLITLAGLRSRLPLAQSVWSACDAVRRMDRVWTGEPSQESAARHALPQSA